LQSEELRKRLVASAIGPYKDKWFDEKGVRSSRA
jgi:hypothetical protein